MRYLKALLAFAYAPNRLGLCGCEDNEIYRLLEKETWNKEEMNRVEKFFGSFPVLNAYLSALAKANGWKKYDEKTVFAYLLGAPQEVYERALPYLKQELAKIVHPSKLELIEKMPSMPLTHTSHVLYFRGIRAELNAPVKHLDFCKVSIGKVLEDGYVLYDMFDGTGFRLSKARINFRFVKAEEGELILHHYRFAFMKITEEEARLYLQNLKRAAEVLGLHYPLEFFLAKI